jgi:hypothetical protein
MDSKNPVLCLVRVRVRLGYVLGYGVRLRFVVLCCVALFAVCSVALCCAVMLCVCYCVALCYVVLCCAVCTAKSKDKGYSKVLHIMGDYKKIRVRVSVSVSGERKV